MQTALTQLEPASVFHYFSEISRIPRPSGKEEAIADYLIGFAKEQGLSWHRDAANNVLIWKEASEGREQEDALLLQGHMDMVCEKESDCTKDMDTEGLDLEVDGDWLSAKGTTLGGDDGIAVAMMLALLSDPALSHPRLECIFTTEEETGMGGAHALDAAPLTGHQLLNIDSEQEGILTVGCAGGESFGVHYPLEKETFAGTPLRVTLGGLTGGHSGIAIHEGRANADLLLLRVLRMLLPRTDFRLCNLAGGSKNNAIPRQAEAVVLSADPAAFRDALSSIEEILQKEYAASDPGLALTCAQEEAAPATALTGDCLRRILALFAALPNGVQRMDQHLKELVETSLSLGILRIEGDALYAEYLLRSALATRMDELDDLMSCVVAEMGGTVERADRFPAWEFTPQSAFRDKMVALYREQYGSDPVVETVHAGLECGLLSEKIPHLDAVSIGPNMEDIHTPQERLSISSTQRVYAYVRSLIENA